MPVVTDQRNSKLKLVFEAGLDENNKPIMKSKTYSNIKPSTSNEDLYNLGMAISELQSYPISSIVRYEEYELLDEI